MALPNMPVGKARKKFYSDLMSVFAEAEAMCYGTYPPDQMDGEAVKVRALRDQTFQILNGGRKPKCLQSAR